ncbi:hypothetical protein BHE74_00019244 [Ensete ventricosum]|nr:hypothetical protein BHE74_00019244 [Ensete ventricosum]
MEKSSHLLVLYASQTGNAMDAAERVGREAERGGCPSVQVLPIDRFDAVSKPIISPIHVFWRFLLQRNLSNQWLEGLHYAVFGLGDSGYQKYNFSAKKLDKRLSDLGAKPLIEKGLGDDQHTSGYVIDYQVGDVLEILPSQNPAAVDAFIQRCNLDPNCYITVCSFFLVMSFYATAEHEKERLQYFASPEGMDDLYQYNQRERRTVVEVINFVLEDFPSVQMPFEWLVQLVPPLKTRAFSISSSPSVHPNQVHLTVSIVSWTTPFKRKRHGLCSSWLAGLDPFKSSGVCIPAWVTRGSLPPPPPSLPLILIGPGTGCAPFRAFVEERALQDMTRSTSPILFFFGCRNQSVDFLYKNFWLAHARDDGVLSADKGGGFFVAFSRDQPQKIYVQHKMNEESKRIWSLLSSGAAIYIAGSSTKMPADVTSTLEEIIAVESGMSKESAARWLRLLEKAGKFFIEAWS